MPSCRAPLLAGGLLTLALFPPSAHADLVIRGPHRDHEALIRSLYAELPARGKNMDVTVQEVTPEEWSHLDAAEDQEAVGVYDDQTREIFLKQGEPDLAWTFVHEYGHHVFFAAMAGSERRDWRQYWKHHQREMPEGDARDDADEGFAECFAGVYCPQKLTWTLAAGLRDKTRAYFGQHVAPEDRSAAQTAMLPGRQQHRRGK